MFLVSLRSKVGGCRTGQHRPESESKESKATKMLHLCHSYDLNIFEFMSFIWIHLPYLAHLCVCFVSCLLGTIEIKAGLSRIHLFLSVTDLDHVASTRSVIVFEILRILRILRWVYLSVPCQVFRSKPQTDPKQSLPMVAVLVRFGRFGWGILRLEPGIGFMEPFAHVGMTSRQLAPLLLWRMVMDLVGWCCEVAWFWYTLNKALLCYTIKVPAKVPFITEIQWVSRTTWEFHDLTFHFLVVLWLFSPSLVFVFHFGHFDHFGHSWPRREAIKESLCANLLRLRGTGFLTVSHDFTCKKVFWCFVPFWSFCTPRPTSTIGIDLKPWRRSASTLKAWNTQDVFDHVLDVFEFLKAQQEKVRQRVAEKKVGQIPGHQSLWRASVFLFASLRSKGPPCSRPGQCQSTSRHDALSVMLNLRADALTQLRASHCLSPTVATAVQLTCLPCSWRIIIGQI